MIVILEFQQGQLAVASSGSWEARFGSGSYHGQCKSGKDNVRDEEVKSREMVFIWQGQETRQPWDCLTWGFSST